MNSLDRIELNELYTRLDQMPALVGNIPVEEQELRDRLMALPGARPVALEYLRELSL